MSPEFRKARYEALRTGEIWGLCVTDAFGMTLDRGPNFRLHKMTPVTEVLVPLEEVQKVPTKRKCSACGNQGHIRMSRLCPARVLVQIPATAPLQLAPPRIPSENTRPLVRPTSYTPSTSNQPPPSYDPFMYYYNPPVVPSQAGSSNAHLAPEPYQLLTPSHYQQHYNFISDPSSHDSTR
ncbi:hypothetical protein QCA50_016372 [Cerrena zonata]|uniref:Zinc knuckle domain-containing protein n=1 Tax=Cerrena zonata TaxID=2478898 RepID=A0AAW0FV49_9APHY